MDLKAEVLERGFTYLESHKRGQGVVIAGLALIASPTDIAKEFKKAHIESQKIHFRQGNLDSAAAAHHLAAWVDEGMQKQEKTFHRRCELIHGVVLNRQLNIKRSLR